VRAYRDAPLRRRAGGIPNSARGAPPSAAGAPDGAASTCARVAAIINSETDSARRITDATAAAAGDAAADIDGKGTLDANTPGSIPELTAANTTFSIRLPLRHARAPRASERHLESRAATPDEPPTQSTRIECCLLQNMPVKHRSAAC
jgi:hypothetical protein